MEDLVGLVPLFVIGAFASIFAFLLAPRVGSNKWLWLLGSLIPVENFFFIYYMVYKIAAHILDKLNFLTGSPRSA